MSHSPADAAWLAAFGLRVRLLRVRLGLTQQQLADAAGLSRNFISELERGAHSLDLLRADHLARALGVPLDQLVARDGTPTLVDMPRSTWPSLIEPPVSWLDNDKNHMASDLLEAVAPGDVAR